MSAGVLYPPPLWAPSRTLALRSGLAFICGIEVAAAGYNARDTNGRPWVKPADPKRDDGWKGTPSEHAYTAGLDVMLALIAAQLYPHDDNPLRVLAKAQQIADWARWVMLDPHWSTVYGWPDLIIFNRRVCTKARPEWRTYTGANPHIDHVHIGLWCPELGDNSRALNH